MAGGKVKAVEITGVAAAVPEAVRTLHDLEQVFGEGQARRVSKSIGVVQRHVSTGGICASDLCFFAAEKLLDALDWERGSVDVLVFVSSNPDYLSPATACTLQHRLNLSKACAAFDINHACSGYVYGLWVVANLLSSGNAKRAVLLVGDTPSVRIAPHDRSVAALMGDAGSATAMEWNESAEPMYFELGTDGGGAQHLLVKAGGFRHPSTTQTRERTEREGGNIRSDEDIYLDGAEIFTFTLREVPPLNEKVLKLAGWTLDDVDTVVMHQANLMMMQHLSQKMGIPKEKLVENLRDYGNTGGSTIPLAMTEKLADQLRNRRRHLILLAFGAGLSWGGVALSCGPLVIPDLTLVSPNDLK